MGPQKVKTWNFHIPSTAKYMPTRIENKYSKKKLAHKEPKVRNNPYILQLMNRKIKLYSHSGILFSHKKK